MSIVIPKRLEKLLKKEPVCLASTVQFCRNIGGLYENSPEFFPDYTFHGVGHINEVLDHADALIEKKSLGKLTAKDAAFLVCAVVLHDAGMFLRPDGVQKLVLGARRGDRIEHSGDEGWEKVWPDFVDRTKRYPEEKMRYLFGRNLTVTESCITKADMTDNDRRIIGEFLRQNHGRMAHEIAVNGLPGTEDIDLFTGTAFTDRERDLIGLLARSHTMAVRDTEPYIRKVFGRGSRPYNTPIFYLMVILRMADALDAGKHRISKFRDVQQKVRVPISVEEWTWNERIDRSICRWDAGEKSRYIHAEPTTSIEYVQLDKWLKGTQAELDLCWSILAEKYADEYCRLSIHRIGCNIHEPDVQETMNSRFLTKEVKVTANPEVTRLLIAPLYGDDPSYGVRELLQNAVDACVERKHKEGGDYKGLVTIRIDPWTDPETGEDVGVCTIEDNGIGMNENVLLNYYLSAGASYRSSDEWKREYTADGKTQVARTGKFGVGFLAAFLLGDSVSVTTRHKDDSIGYAFSFTNKSEPLNVRRVEREVGTTIEIRLREGVKNSMDLQLHDRSHKALWYNWYAFDEPQVRYFFNSEEIPYEGISISRENPQNAGWFHFKTDNYERYFWMPNYNHHFFNSHKFFCNGIRVYGSANSDILSQCGVDISEPNISLIDMENELDVDLSRAKVQSFPEEYLLVNSVIKYHIARLLMTSWDAKNACNRNIKYGFVLYRGNMPSFLLSAGGFQLNNSAVLSVANASQFLFLYYNIDRVEAALEAVRQLLLVDVPCCICTDEHIKDFLNKTFSYRSMDLSSYVDGYVPQNHSCKLWIRADYASHVIRCKLFVDADSEAPGNDIWQYQNRHMPPMDTPINWEHFDPHMIPVAIQIMNPRKDGDTLFAQVLRDVLEPAPGYDRNDIWIPFDMEERKKKFPKAFRELEVYMDAIKKDPEAHHVNL